MKRQLESFGIRRELDNAGRITLPVSFRREFGIEPHDEVILCLTEQGIIIKPAGKGEEED